MAIAGKLFFLRGILGTFMWSAVACGGVLPAIKPTPASESRTTWTLDDFTRLQRDAATYELVWADEFDRDGRPDSTN